jgi:hypothetical protein
MARVTTMAVPPASAVQLGRRSATDNQAAITRRAQSTNPCRYWLPFGESKPCQISCVGVQRNEAVTRTTKRVQVIRVTALTAELKGSVAARSRAAVPTYRLALRPTPSDSGRSRAKKFSSGTGTKMPGGEGAARPFALKTGMRMGADNARPSTVTRAWRSTPYRRSSQPRSLVSRRATRNRPAAIVAM